MGKLHWRLLNNQQGIPYVAGPKPESMPSVGWYKT